MLRAVRIALVVVFSASCSSGGGDAADRRPAKAGDAAPAKTLKLVRNPQPERAAGDVWAGTFEGRTEPAPAPMPSRNVAKGVAAPDAGPESSRWSGNGTLRLEASGETVTGTLDGGGVTCKVGGSLVAGKLRGWLRSEGSTGGPTGPTGAMHGNLQGVAEGEAIRGTWRVSTSAGVEVRTGTFQIRKE